MSIEQNTSESSGNRLRGRGTQPQERLKRITKAWHRGQEIPGYRDSVVARVAGVSVGDVKAYLETRGYHPNNRYVFGRRQAGRAIDALRRQRQ